MAGSSVGLALGSEAQQVPLSLNAHQHHVMRIPTNHLAKALSQAMSQARGISKYLNWNKVDSWEAKGRLFDNLSKSSSFVIQMNIFQQI